MEQHCLNRVPKNWGGGGLCVRLLKKIPFVLALENHSPQSRGAVRNPLQSALDVLENLAFSPLQHVALHRPNRLF